jgi:hypothetical protein
MNKTVLVHGFNVRDGGKRSVDTLAPMLEALGHNVDLDEADYGYWSLFKIYFGAKGSVYKRLQAAFEDADLIVTHSNGANFAIQALRRMERDNKKRVVVHLSPALKRNTPAPPNIIMQYVYHTLSDFAVRLSTYLPFLPWGRMGSHGSTRIYRTVNRDFTGMVRGHSGWFDRPRCTAISIHMDYEDELS